MSRKMTAVVTALALLFVWVLLSAGPAFAFTGVNISVTDNVQNNDWAFGGDVIVLANGAIAATGELDGNGDLNLTYGTDTLGLCGGPCATPASGDTMTVFIDFDCNTSANCTGGPNGTPPSASTTYTELGLPFANSVAMKTSTGPLAVTLNATGSAPATSLPVIVLSFATIMAVASVWVVRRRTIANQI